MCASVNDGGNCAQFMHTSCSPAASILYFFEDVCEALRLVAFSGQDKCFHCMATCHFTNECPNCFNGAENGEKKQGIVKALTLRVVVKK